VYDVWDILRERLGHNFVSSHRTFKPKNLKPINISKNIGLFPSLDLYNVFVSNLCFTSHLFSWAYIL